MRVSGGEGGWTRWRLAASVLGAALATLAAVGCEVVTVRESAEARPPVVVFSAREVEHDLAVAGVTFEPAAGPNSSGGSLIAIIDNRGTSRAFNVGVRVLLLGGDGREALAEQSSVITSLAGGETRAVTFRTSPNVPLRARYVLVVEVDPVPGETELANNRRTFEVLAGVATGGGSR